MRYITTGLGTLGLLGWRRTLIGDVVKDIIRNLEHNVGDLIGYIMTDGPGG